MFVQQYSEGELRSDAVVINKYSLRQLPSWHENNSSINKESTPSGKLVCLGCLGEAEQHDVNTQHNKLYHCKKRQIMWILIDDKDVL